MVPTTIASLTPPAGDYVVSATGAAVQQGNSNNRDHCELELNSTDFGEVDSWPTSSNSIAYGIVGTTSVSTGDTINLVCWLQSGNGIGAVTQNDLVASQVDAIN